VNYRISADVIGGGNFERGTKQRQKKKCEEKKIGRE
jgi:hypothetical protein